MTDFIKRPLLHARLSEFLLILLLIGGAVALFMGNSLSSCNDTLLRGPGDATAGFIWLNEIQDSPWPGYTNMANAPYGENLWRPHYITAQALFLPFWTLTKLTSATCAWNLMVLIGLASTGLITYFFLKRLTKSPLSAVFGALALTLTPFHQYKAEGHLAYIFSGWLVLTLWSLINLWQKPRPKHALALALATALLCYTDGYFILFGLVLIGSFLIGGIIHHLLTAQPWRLLVRRLAYQGVAGVLTLVLLLPIAYIFLTQGNQIAGELSSQRSDIVSESLTYSARPHEYLLPAATHPVFDKFIEGYKISHLHNSNLSESTLFIGYSVMILALIYLGHVIRLGRKKAGLAEQQNRYFYLLILGALVLGAGLTSAPPYLWAFGYRWLMPSGVIVNLTSNWRVFSRLYMVVEIGFVALAALGLSVILKRFKSTPSRILATSLLIGLVLFEFLTFWPGHTSQLSGRSVWDYSQAPHVYHHLAVAANVDTIAEYPLVEPPRDHYYNYLTYQLVHGKKIINTSRVNSPQATLRAALQNLDHPQTLPVLRALGVDRIFWHNAQPLPLNTGLRLLEHDTSVSSDPIWVYEIVAGPQIEPSNLDLVIGPH